MYISIDIGGTNTRLASIESLQKPIINDKSTWKDTHQKRADKATLVQKIEELDVDIKAFGIGITGTMDDENKSLISTNWNKEWIGVPLVDVLSSRFGCPVFVENDAVTASLGVAYYAEGKNKNFSYITWGTGIGGAQVSIVNSKPHSNKFSWSNYFKDWEEKSGGNKIEEEFGKKADLFSKNEWNIVINDFENEFVKFNEKVKDDFYVFGGGISEKRKNDLIQKKLVVTKLGNDVGLFGGAALILNKSENL